MGTIVKDFPPEEETLVFDQVQNSSTVLFPSATTIPSAILEADDEALARRLQTEWDASDAAAAQALAATPHETIPSHSTGNTNASANASANVSANANANAPGPAAASAVTSESAVSQTATLSNPWEFDAEQAQCSSCGDHFHALNRRHHCRFCGKIFCHKCSDQRALIPPSAIVLTPTKGGKKAKPPTTTTDPFHQQFSGSRSGANSSGIGFTPDPDPDRMLTYIDEDNQLLYGKGLEERFQLAREPLRVCRACHDHLQPLQEELRTTNSNAMRFNHIDPTDPKRFLNSPLAFTLGHEIRKAAYTLNNMLPLPKRLGSTMGFADTPNSRGYGNGNNSQHQFDEFLTGEDLDIQQCKDECATITPNFSNLDGVRIPARLLEEAKGVAVLTVAKGGFGLAGVEFGTGLVVARLGDDQQWSAPCAIGTAGLSWGALIGAQVSDHVFLLMTDASVELMFNNDGNLQLGADVGVAVGPVGRALEADFAASPGAFAPIYTYSLSKGIYAGISLDGKMIVTRNRVNERFYGREVTGQQILNGEIPSPPAARPLYDALHRCHVYAKNDAGGNSSNSCTSALLNRPKTHTMHGYPEVLPSDLDPYSQNFNSNNMMNMNGDTAATMGQLQQHQQYSSSQQTPLDYGDPLIPPGSNDQHSFTGQSHMTGMSDITSDPGY
mmetsp:Transcript_14283/g.30262  ORF Transcript_14283/g.30262 Transcript_14283/m.30262 type:complete len:668 (-) Transcript_14283:278-2281(-)